MLSFYKDADFQEILSIFRRDCLSYGYAVRDIDIDGTPTTCMLSLDHFNLKTAKQEAIDSKIDELFEAEAINSLVADSYILLPECINVLTVANQRELYIQELFNIINLNFKPIKDRAYLESVIPHPKG